MYGIIANNYVAVTITVHIQAAVPNTRRTIPHAHGLDLGRPV